MTDRSMTEMLTGERFPSMRNKWHSVLRAHPMWPGEYQNPVDPQGKPHGPWSLNLNYFECCTCTPFTDCTRGSAFVATELSPLAIATMLGWTAPLEEPTLDVEDGGGQGEEDDSFLVTEGGSTLFYIERQEDMGVDGTLCTITAFSSRALVALVSLTGRFKTGTCALVPHGRFEHTIQTKLGPKRLVRVVGIDENDVDSSSLAAHFTIEDDAAVAYQPSPADDMTLPDRVIARAVLAFRSGGWGFFTSPTIESIVARRDYHGHALTRDLFGAVESWFLSVWTLDTHDGVRALQATELTNAIVDGVPVPGGGGGGGVEHGETGACRGLTAVTDKQLLYDTLGFRIHPPAAGSIAGMMSRTRPKDEEGVMVYPRTKHGSRKVFRSGLLAGTGIGWRSCDYCFAVESMTSRLEVCDGCLCERYYAGRYCSALCQTKDLPRHLLSCGKTRSEMQADHDAFRDGLATSSK